MPNADIILCPKQTLCYLIWQPHPLMLKHFDTTPEGNLLTC